MNTERKLPRYDAANINSNTRRPHAQLSEHDKSDFKPSRITRHKYDLGAGDSKNSKYNKDSDLVGASNENDDGNARDSRYDRTSYRPRRYDNDEKSRDYVNGGSSNSRYGRNSYNDRYENDRKDSNGNRALSNGKGTGTSSNAGSSNNNKPNSRSDFRRTGDKTASANSTPAPAHTTTTTNTTTTKRDELHDKPVNKVIIHYKSDIASGSTWSKEKSGPTFADMVRMRNEAKAKAANADKATPEPSDATVANSKEGKSTSDHATTEETKLSKKNTRDGESKRRTSQDKQESTKSAQDDESEHDSHSSHHDDDDDEDSISSNSHNEDNEDEDEEENENEVEDEDEEEDMEEEQHEAEEEDEGKDEKHDNGKAAISASKAEEEEEDEDEDEDELNHQRAVEMVMKTASIGIGVGTDTLVSETIHLTVPDTNNNMQVHAMEQEAHNAMHQHPHPANSEAMHNPTVADVVNALASETDANLASLSETPIKPLHIPVAPAVPEPTYYVLEIDRVDSVKLPANTNNNNSDNTSSSANQTNASSRSDVIYTFSAQPGKAPSPTITSQAINTMPTSISSNMNTPSASKVMNTTSPIPSAAANNNASTAAAMAAASALSNHSSSSSMANPSSANIPSMYRGDFNSMTNMRQWAMSNAEHNNNSNNNTNNNNNANRLGPPHSWQNMNGPSLTSNNNNNNINTANNNAALPQSTHPSSASTSALSASAFSAAALSAVANNASSASASASGGGIGGNNHLSNVNMDYWSNPMIAERAVADASRFARSQQLQYNSYPIPLHPHLQAQQQQQQQQLRAQAGAFPSRLRSSELSEASLRPPSANLGFVRTAPGGGIWEAPKREAFINYNNFSTEDDTFRT